MGVNDDDLESIRRSHARHRSLGLFVACSVLSIVSFGVWAHIYFHSYIVQGAGCPMDYASSDGDYGRVSLGLNSVGVLVFRLLRGRGRRWWSTTGLGVLLLALTSFLDFWLVVIPIAGTTKCFD